MQLIHLNLSSITLTLAENPFYCDDTLKDLVEWIQTVDPDPASETGRNPNVSIVNWDSTYCVQPSDLELNILSYLNTTLMIPVQPVNGEDKYHQI